MIAVIGITFFFTTLALQPIIKGNLGYVIAIWLFIVVVAIWVTGFKKLTSKSAIYSRDTLTTLAVFFSFLLFGLSDHIETVLRNWLDGLFFGSNWLLAPIAFVFLAALVAVPVLVYIFLNESVKKLQAEEAAYKESIAELEEEDIIKRW